MISQATFWVVALCLSPLVFGLLLMLLPENLWRNLVPTLDQGTSIMTLIATGLLCLGIALVCLYSLSLWNGWRSSQWQPVSAVVIESRLKSHIAPRSSLPYWSASVHYQYRINESTYHNDRVSFGENRTANREALETELQQRWKPGTTVQAWVNPERPTQAVLETGASGWLAVFVGAGMVLSTIGIYFLNMIRKDRLTARATRQQQIDRRKKKRLPKQASRKVGTLKSRKTLLCRKEKSCRTKTSSH